MANKIKRFDLFITVASLLTLFLDVGTDVTVTVQYYLNGDTVWGSLMLVFTVIPFVVMNVFSVKWHATDGSLTWSTGLPHLLLLAPFQRYMRVLWYGYKSYQTDQQYFTTTALREQNDATILRLFETFLESAPQLVLQLYVMLVNPNHVDWIQGISACSSLISLAWAVTAYCDTLRLNYQTGYRRRFAALCSHYCWQLFMVSARVTALVLFTSIFKAWVCLFAGIHCIIMIVWIWLNKTDFGQGKAEQTLFRIVSGFMYIFVYLNVHDGPTRCRMVFYYSLMVLENTVLFAIWTATGEPSYDWITAAVVLIYGAFILGILCLLVYYRWLHPRGPNYLFSVSSTLSPSQQKSPGPRQEDKLRDARFSVYASPTLEPATFDSNTALETPAKENAREGNLTLSYLLDSASKGELITALESLSCSSQADDTNSLDSFTGNKFQSLHFNITDEPHPDDVADDKDSDHRCEETYSEEDYGFLKRTPRTRVSGMNKEKSRSQPSVLGNTSTPVLYHCSANSSFGPSGTNHNGVWCNNHSEECRVSWTTVPLAESECSFITGPASPHMARRKRDSSLRHKVCFPNSLMSDTEPKPLQQHCSRCRIVNSDHFSPTQKPSSEMAWQHDYKNMYRTSPMECGACVLKCEQCGIVDDHEKDCFRHPDLQSASAKSASSHLSPDKMSLRVLEESPQRFGRSVDLFDRTAWRNILSYDPDETTSSCSAGRQQSLSILYDTSCSDPSLDHSPCVTDRRSRSLWNSPHFLLQDRHQHSNRSRQSQDPQHSLHVSDSSSLSTQSPGSHKDPYCLIDDEETYHTPVRSTQEPSHLLSRSADFTKVDQRPKEILSNLSKSEQRPQHKSIFTTLESEWPYSTLLHNHVHAHNDLMSYKTRENLKVAEDVDCTFKYPTLQRQPFKTLDNLSDFTVEDNKTICPQTKEKGRNKYRNCSQGIGTAGTLRGKILRESAQNASTENDPEPKVAEMKPYGQRYCKAATKNISHRMALRW